MTRTSRQVIDRHTHISGNTLSGVVGVDEDDSIMPPILGQVDLIEDGFISGWACHKVSQEIDLEVKFFVNEVLIGSVFTDGRALHPLVDRICAGPANIGKDGEDVRNIAFKFQMPQLNEGLYQVHTRTPLLAMYVIEDVWMGSCGLLSTVEMASGERNSIRLRRDLWNRWRLLD